MFSLNFFIILYIIYLLILFLFLIFLNFCLYSFKFQRKDSNIMTLINNLMEISELDLRHNFTDFYFTFDLDNFYSKPAVNMIMTGKKENESFNAFLERCLKIYRTQTNDYSSRASLLPQKFKEYNETHIMPLTFEKLADSLNSDASTINRIIRSQTPSKTANNIYDVLSMDLFNYDRSAKTIFNNVSAYNELKKRIMRAEIGDGKTTKTLEDVAKESGIELEILNHLEKVCKDDNLYLDTYQKLVDVQLDYVI